MAHSRWRPIVVKECVILSLSLPISLTPVGGILMCTIPPRYSRWCQIHLKSQMFHSNLPPLDCCKRGYVVLGLSNSSFYRPTRPVASQPGGGGSELGWVEHQAHPPPLGHCPRDVIRPPNEKLENTPKGWNKIFGMGNWGGVVRSPRPPPPGYGPAYTV